MTFDDLTRTLRSALADGKIGVPVSVRLHLQTADVSTDAGSDRSDRALTLFDDWLASIGEAFSSEPSTLMARRHPTADQWNVLVRFQGGQTALLTVGFGAASVSQVHLLVVGNHGIIRLEGGELFEPTDRLNSGSDDLRRASGWRSVLQESLTRNRQIPVEQRGTS